MPHPIITEAIPVSNEAQIDQVIMQKAKELNIEAASALNLNAVDSQIHLLKQTFPGVFTFYSVKSNNHPALLRRVKENGLGFECSSMLEADMVLKAGASPADILMGNVTLSQRCTADSLAAGIRLFTVDSEPHIRRIVAAAGADAKSVKLLLRVKGGVLEPVQVKSGANEVEARRYIRLCKSLGANLAGLSFNVDTAPPSAEAYTEEFALCGRLAEYAGKQGFEISYLNFGGGFVSDKAALHYRDTWAKQGKPSIPSFAERAAAINKGIKSALPSFPCKSVRVVAAIGEFISADALVVGIRVFGRRFLFDEEKTMPPCVSEKELLAKGARISDVIYIVGDGLFGFFYSVYIDRNTPHTRFARADGAPIPFDHAKAAHDQKCPRSNIFGPTCASCDHLIADLHMPILEIGDWIFVDAYGAYSNVLASDFNGIQIMPIYPVNIK